MTTVVTIIFVWHNCDVVDQYFQLIMVEILNELVVIVLELLETVIIVKKLVDVAVFAVQ
jgi:hypothetical protein